MSSSHATESPTLPSTSRRSRSVRGRAARHRRSTSARAVRTSQVSASSGAGAATTPSSVRVPPRVNPKARAAHESPSGGSGAFGGEGRATWPLPTGATIATGARAARFVCASLAPSSDGPRMPLTDDDRLRVAPAARAHPLARAAAEPLLAVAGLAKHWRGRPAPTLDGLEISRCVRGR